MTFHAHAMLERHQPSPFLDTAAVDAWDAWFRLREHGELRDVSVETTWKRVANALVERETDSRTTWCARLFEAQAQWRLLIDARIIATAGTAKPEWPADPVAVLNAASFVEAAYKPQAHVDHDMLANMAEL